MAKRKQSTTVVDHNPIWQIDYRDAGKDYQGRIVAWTFEEAVRIFKRDYKDSSIRRVFKTDDLPVMHEVAVK